MNVVRVDVVEVVNVGVVKDGGVADERVMHVNSLDEIATAMEPGKERFAETKREPSDTKARAETKAESAAEESDERWTINGIAEDRAGAPTPPAAEVIPTTIVEGSKTPGLIANPRPTPGANIVPIPIAVGSPIRANVIGIPDMTVFRFVLPRTVVVQVGIADGVTRNVLRRNRVLFLEVALGGPVIEGVRW